ncbi:MAG: tetratricopeptide repeat protein [Caldilineaceae bacterium]
MRDSTQKVSFHSSAEQRVNPFTETDFIQWVNAALKNYQSGLALARSPLANSALVQPLLVLDDVSPTAEERGQAMRLILQWAVNRLAPATVQYPLGEFRPLDDPAWRDPHWWRYNILRHRYLEPLHPDEFVEGGRTTETLIALTGISSTDTFFDERNRAVREMAQCLHQQLLSGDANDELQQLALEAFLRSLQGQDMAQTLLGIAATFDDVFPRVLLLQMASRESLKNAEAALDYLITHRFLLMGDGVLNLWLSTVLQKYIYARQPHAKLRLRHQLIANYYKTEHEPLKAARHLQQAQQWSEAATILFDVADELIHDLQLDEIYTVLLAFKHNYLTPAQWYKLQLLLADLFAKSGRQEEAMTACRRALQVALDDTSQARVYRRMGKLYENRNQLHALGYYQQAGERFTSTAPEYLDLLKDRAWLYIMRQEWEKAEIDLKLALTQVIGTTSEQRANIYDALAYLYDRQKLYPLALQYGQDALTLREQIGDMSRVAHSFVNLGLIYTDMSEYTHAIEAHQEASAVYKQLGNLPLVATALLNIGMAYHLDGRLHNAVQVYKESLAICSEISAPLQEVAAHSNLAEAFAQLGQNEKAIYHWQTGYELSCQAGFEGQIKYFKELREKIPALEMSEAGVVAQTEGATPTKETAIDPEVQAVLQVATHAGHLTPKLLMETLHISKATATRRLAELVERGYLEKRGEGRGTYYTLCDPNRQRALSAARQTQAGELAAIQQKLRQQEQHLRQQYGITALGLVMEPAHKTLTGVVRFAVLPDLLRFFALEKELGGFLGIPFDLMPDDATDLASVVWLWP